MLSLTLELGSIATILAAILGVVAAPPALKFNVAANSQYIPIVAF